MELYIPSSDCIQSTSFWRRLSMSPQSPHNDKTHPLFHRLSEDWSYCCGHPCYIRNTQNPELSSRIRRWTWLLLYCLCAATHQKTKDISYIKPEISTHNNSNINNNSSNIIQSWGIYLSPSFGLCCPPKTFNPHMPIHF